MTFTVKEFSDLLNIMDENPEWRDKMVEALFPRVNFAQALQDLADAFGITDTELKAMRLEREQASRMAASERERIEDKVDAGFAEAKGERGRIEDKVDVGFAEAKGERGRIEDKVDVGFAEAKAERERIEDKVDTGFAEAKAEREKGFAEAKGERKRIEDKVDAGFVEAKGEREKGFAEAKAEREKGFAEVKAEYRAGFAEVKAEYRAGFAEVKAEYRAGFAEAKAEREKGFAEAKTERAELRRDVATLKGMGHEDFYLKKADAVFGGYLKNERNATNWIADQLYASQDAGKISKKELAQVLASDLLWRGKLRTTGDEVVLVLEASWLIEAHDIERAAARAGILGRLNINAIPVVAGREWTDAMRQLAAAQSVVMTDNGRVNDSSWQAALKA